jgi:NADH-quinone oxidoreductase subunit N
MFLNELKYLIPELFLLFVIIGMTVSCIIFDNLTPLRVGYRLDFIRLHTYVFLLSLIFLAFLVFNTLDVEYVVFNGLLYGNIGTALVKVLLVIVFFSVFSVSLAYYKGNFNGYEFLVLLLIVLLSLFLIISSADFMSLFFSFEMLSLSLYILVAYKRDSIFSTEGGLRYFILGAFTSCMLALGISFIYYVFGTTNFFTISLLGNLYGNNLNNDSFLFFGVIFVLVAFLFKLSAFPFHFWTPDVYQGAPILITKVLATSSKIGVLTVLIKLLGDVFFFYNSSISFILVLSGVGSVIIGTIGSLFQFKLKRLLAYSTIGNMGYILLALSLGTFDGYVAAYFYVVVYVLLNINIFSILISFVRHFTGRVLSDISELVFLSTVYPIWSLVFVFSLFSIAGVPPLAGFFSKFYIFYALVEEGYTYLVIFLVIMSIISAGYYLRLVNFLYFQGEKRFAMFRAPSLLSSIVIAFTFVLNISFMLYAKQFLLLIEFLIRSLIV